MDNYRVGLSTNALSLGESEEDLIEVDLNNKIEKAFLMIIEGGIASIIMLVIAMIV